MFYDLPSFEPYRCEVIILLKKDVTARDLARLERDGWDSYLGKAYNPFIVFKRELWR